MFVLQPGHSGARLEYLTACTCMNLAQQANISKHVATDDILQPTQMARRPGTRGLLAQLSLYGAALLEDDVQFRIQGGR